MKKIDQPLENCQSDALDNLSDYISMAIEPLWLFLAKMEEEEDRCFILMDPILREVNRRITGTLEAIKRDVGDIKISFNYAKRQMPELVLGAQLAVSGAKG